MKNFLLYSIAFTLLLTISLCIFKVIDYRTFMGAVLMQLMILRFAEKLKNDKTDDEKHAKE